MIGLTEVSVDRIRCNLLMVNICMALFKKRWRPCAEALTVELRTCAVWLWCEVDVRLAFRDVLVDKVKFKG